MSEPVKSQERIVILIDPNSKTAELYNFTGCKEVDVDGAVDIVANEKEEPVLKLDLSIILKGRICRPAKK